MAINGVSQSTVTTGSNVATTPAPTTTTADASKTTSSNTTTNSEAAVYESTEKEKKASSEKHPVDMDKVNKMIAESKKQVDSFRKLLEKIINKQGTTAEVVLEKIDAGEEVMVEIDPEVRAQAQKDISEDGYYGVKQTSERILDFAKAISGGDPTKIAELKKAVEDGFAAAKEVWGGELPEISQKTHDAVMKGFEEWENAAKNPAPTTAPTAAQGVAVQ